MVGVGQNDDGDSTGYVGWGPGPRRSYGGCCYPVLEIQGVLPQGHETGAFCQRENGRAFKEDGVSREASLSNAHDSPRRITALIKTPTSLAGLSAKLQAPFSYNEAESKVCGRGYAERRSTHCNVTRASSWAGVVDKQTGHINHFLISTLSRSAIIDTILHV